MTNSAQPVWLALDIGGANLKVAHQAGQVRHLPFELWKHPETLPTALRELAARLPPFDAVALTMTADAAMKLLTEERLEAAS